MAPSTISGTEDEEDTAADSAGGGGGGGESVRWTRGFKVATVHSAKPKLEKAATSTNIYILLPKKEDIHIKEYLASNQDCKSE